LWLHGSAGLVAAIGHTPGELGGQLVVGNADVERRPKFEEPLPGAAESPVVSVGSRAAVQSRKRR
jgi:hypothetical protein